MKLEDFIDAGYKVTQLHGGTVGDVKLITGIAGDKIVLKTQHKWERYGDSDSWRREYDLYTSDFGKLFNGNLRWPECYHAEINDDETQIWMEYIDGVSGRELTVEMLEQAAFELGRFQSRVSIPNQPYFTQLEWTKHYYTEYRAQTKEYAYLRSDECKLPEHLRQMLINIEYSAVEHLPIVFCHRDFWHENIIYSGGKIRLIDWDCAGWGLLGEDIIQLVTDEVDPNHLEEYFRRFVPAYLKGFGIDNIDLWKMLVVKHGYSSIHSPDVLQKIYEMRDLHVTN